MSFYCEFLEYWNTKKVLGGFDNIFHVYMMRGFQKYGRNWILTVAFWGQTKAGPKMCCQMGWIGCAIMQVTQKGIVRIQILLFFRHIWISFTKTEVQTVNMRCWTGLKPNWFKTYGTNARKCKNAKIAKIAKIGTNITQMSSFFLQNQKKIENGNICVLCHNLHEPIRI